MPFKIIFYFLFDFITRRLNLEILGLRYCLIKVDKIKHTICAPHIAVTDLEMAYGSFVVMRDINFGVSQGQILVIMGGSGCGKSTLLKHLIGLIEPFKGRIFYDGEEFSEADDEKKRKRLRTFGVLYQGGALWSAMTLEENVGLPLREYTNLNASQVKEIVSLKLALVGLRGFESFYPAEISGGMRKRAGLARAMALDPEILFFDEPSAGLDPLSSKRLDDLILEIRDSLRTTVVVVTHELASIFAIADTAIYLDADTRTMLAQGSPHELLENPPDPKIREFLMRGKDGI